MERKIVDYSEAISKWARENGLRNDPDRLSKMYDEARRRWPKLTTLRIGQVLGPAKPEAEKQQAHTP